MGRIIPFALIAVIAIIVVRKSFINTSRDTGLIRQRGWFLLISILSALTSYLGAWGWHREGEMWGYISLAFLLVFCVLVAARHQLSKR